MAVGTLHSFGSMADFTALFDGVMEGGQDGLWRFDPTGSSESGSTGPGTNNTLPFVHTETSRSNASVTAAQFGTNGTCTMKAAMIPDRTDRMLRIRACLAGLNSFQHADEGLYIDHRAADSEAWQQAAFIRAWQYAATVNVGDALNYEFGGAVMFRGEPVLAVAAGGWGDFVFPFPDGATQLRLRPHYLFQSPARPQRHDMALAEMQWSWPDGPLEGQPINVEATISAATLTPTRRLTGQPLTASATISQAQTSRTRRLAGQPLAALAAISAGAVSLTRKLTGQTLSVVAELAKGRLIGLNPPVQPRHVTVSDIDHSGALVVWDLAEAPKPPLTGWEYRIGNGPWIATGSTAPRLRLTGLDVGTAYAIQIRGRNRIGAGAPSVAENFETLPAEVATVTRFVTAAPTGGRSVDLGWQDPAFDGGEPLTGFEVCVVPPHGPVEPWENVGLVRAHRVRGLALGHEYGFRVRAVNDVGAGAQSPLVYATPAETATVAIPPGFQLPLVDTDRQSLIVRLDAVDCRVEVWWQPTDRAWYASLEAPLGSPVMSGRRLAVNAGLLAGRPGVLAGDVVCRAVDEADQERDPDRFAWGIDSHGLFWEPAAA